MNAPLHHDAPWRWKMSGGTIKLVRDGTIVLRASLGTALQTTGSDGHPRNLEETDAVARLIAAAPDIQRAAWDLVHGVRLGLVKIESTERGKDFSLNQVMQRLIEALERSGGHHA